MLKLFKKKEKQNKVLSSMANGKSVAIEDVPDEVFSTKMMGDGIAVIPDDGKVIDGELYEELRGTEGC